MSLKREPINLRTAVPQNKAWCYEGKGGILVAVEVHDSVGGYVHTDQILVSRRTIEAYIRRLKGDTR